MNTCAVQLEGCYERTIGFRGICSNCYHKLIELGEIKDGEFFQDFPEWLKDMIRNQNNCDKTDERHPTVSYDELVGKGWEPCEDAEYIK
jgi:hypothetical protein